MREKERKRNRERERDREKEKEWTESRIGSFAFGNIDIQLQLANFEKQ
jgi:hypothetical protein